jgi:hypothetical protein
MIWQNAIEKAPIRQEEVWDTNERINDEWCKRVNRRGAKNSQRNNRMYVGAFIRMFTALVTTLERADIEAFVERISRKCSRLILSEPPSA